MKFKQYDEFIKYLREIHNRCNIYIWGTSTYGGLLGEVFNKYSIEWYGYVDNFTTDIGEYQNGKKIISGLNVKVNTADIFILSMRKYNAVHKQLISLGAKDEQIICIDSLEIFNEIENEILDIREYSKKIAKFKDTYNTKRCFIIGNGPSLTIQDLNMLHNEITFASNLIFQCFDKTDWRPTFYFFIDPNGIRTVFDKYEKVKYMSNSCESMFVRGNGSMYQYKDDKTVNNLYFLNSKFSKDEEIFQFSTECDKVVYIGYTVTYAMLQMAAYMGFEEIYLLGMDHTFSVIKTEDGRITKGEISHEEEHSPIFGEYNMPAGSEQSKVTKAYESAKMNIEKNSGKIYNATRGGELEVFERVDFNKLFQSK